MNQRSAKKTILLFEDDALLAEAYEVFLEQGGYHVIHHVNSANIINLVETYAPVMVITDLVMDENDGVEGIFLLKETHDIPILAISSYQKYLDLISSEVSATLTKPISEETLLEKVALLLAGHSKSFQTDN